MQLTLDVLSLCGQYILRRQNQVLEWSIVEFNNSHFVFYVLLFWKYSTRKPEISILALLTFMPEQFPRDQTELKRRSVSHEMV